MVCFTNYCLTVPKSNLANYTKYILQGIYNFMDEDLWFLKDGLTHEEKKKCHRVELNNETEDHYEIAFRWCNFTALVNVLPTTIVTPGRSYFTDKEVLQEAKSLISTEVDCASSDLACFTNKKVLLDTKLLPSLIKQLATDGIIQKYFPFDDEKAFICVSDGVPLIVGTSKGKLAVGILNFLLFDFDDGFNGADKIDKLIEHFKVWKAAGDITLPVVAPNDLTVCDEGSSTSTK